VSILVTFEHPLNERIRTFLRIEHLDEQLRHFQKQTDLAALRMAINTLLDLITITARSDLKNDILKELDRIFNVLKRVGNQPSVNPRALEQILENVYLATGSLRRFHSPIGLNAREDEFLKAISQRSSLPGGACSFDLPQYHYWLLQAPDVHQARFAHWLSDLEPAIEAVQLILSLVRSSAATRSVTAVEGFFQEALIPDAPTQLLRVRVATTHCRYPEISGHKNRYSVRFMAINAEGRTHQCTADVPFNLTCCVF
jgi:cell division protein ZapD